jgi:hypothetical protein
VDRLTEALWLVVAVVIVLALAAPALGRLAAGLVPLLLVGGIVAGVLRVVWAVTRRW